MSQGLLAWKPILHGGLVLRGFGNLLVAGICIGIVGGREYLKAGALSKLLGLRIRRWRKMMGLLCLPYLNFSAGFNSLI